MFDLFPKYEVPQLHRADLDASRKTTASQQEERTMIPRCMAEASCSDTRR